VKIEVIECNCVHHCCVIIGHWHVSEYTRYTFDL